MADTSGAGAEDHVDEELLAELFSVLDEGDAGGLVQACELFSTGVPARLDDLARALAAGGYDEAARIAHSVKGSAGAFGARRLAALAGRLEQACGRPGATTPAEAEALLGELRQEFSVFRAILDARLADLAT